MNDLETRAEQAFRDALSRQADAFEPASLAPVRRPPHSRRIGMIAVAASVLLVLGTTIGVALWRGSSADRGPAEDTAGPTAGWRYESYRDVQIEVPDAWGYDYAPSSDWCVDESSVPRGPYVDIGGRGVRSILCGGKPSLDLHGNDVPMRLWATHVTLGEPGDVPDGTETADGWTRIARTVGAAQVRVLTDSENLDEAHEIAESARVIEADHNGCAASSPIQADSWVRPSEPFDVADLTDVDSIAVCNYAIGVGTVEPWLLASRMLTGTAADDVLAAIQAAPVGGGPDRPNLCVHDVEGAGTVLRLESGDMTRTMYLYNATCVNNGFDDGTNRRELTVAACVPLYGERASYLGFDMTPGAKCHPELATAAPKP